jgi:hypothetical protein
MSYYPKMILLRNNWELDINLYELLTIVICFRQEEFEDTKGVIRIRKSKKNRQHNLQHNLQNIHIKHE